MAERFISWSSATHDAGTRLHIYQTWGGLVPVADSRPMTTKFTSGHSIQQTSFIGKSFPIHFFLFRKNNTAVWWWKVLPCCTAVDNPFHSFKGAIFFTLGLVAESSLLVCPSTRPLRTHIITKALYQGGNREHFLPRIFDPRLYKTFALYILCYSIFRMYLLLLYIDGYRCRKGTDK